MNMIQLGAIPLSQFTAVHPDAKVTAEELSLLKTYLAPWAPLQASVASGVVSAELPKPVSASAVKP